MTKKDFILFIKKTIVIKTTVKRVSLYTDDS
jgi:hypothetical protein